MTIFNGTNKKIYRRRNALPLTTYRILFKNIYIRFFFRKCAKKNSNGHAGYYIRMSFVTYI